MKQNHTIWLLCALLSVSVIANVLLAKASLSYFDDVYVAIAEQHFINSKVRDHLDNGNVKAAKEMLDQEIEVQGSILAVCLMEGCSDGAKNTVQEYSKP